MHSCLYGVGRVKTTVAQGPSCVHRKWCNFRHSRKNTQYTNTKRDAHNSNRESANFEDISNIVTLIGLDPAQINSKFSHHTRSGHLPTVVNTEIHNRTHHMQHYTSDKYLPRSQDWIMYFHTKRVHWHVPSLSEKLSITKQNKKYCLGWKTEVDREAWYMYDRQCNSACGNCCRLQSKD